MMAPAITRGTVAACCTAIAFFQPSFSNTMPENSSDRTVR